MNIWTFLIFLMKFKVNVNIFRQWIQYACHLFVTISEMHTIYRIYENVNIIIYFFHKVIYG